MSPHRLLALGAAAALLLSTTTGCGAAIIRQRAAFDFGCPESQITLVGAGGAVGATGCGKKATYMYVDGTGWVRNSEVLPAK